MPRLSLPVLAALALVLVSQASSAGNTSALSKGPASLRAFMLRADEPIAHAYSRTPSFTWAPVALTGGHYQFQIATSKSFQDGTLVFKDMSVSQPAETVPRQLPWMTGVPYALWANVRWISKNGRKATPWSVPFGFNLEWASGDVPAPMPAPEGLHNALGYATIHWRVRAIRDVGQFKSSTNGLPAVSYGPWSPIYATVNNPQTNGTLKPTDTVSDTWDKAGKAGTAHQLTPGFAWAPSAPVISESIDPGSSLYRVYIFSDKNCVNRIFTGSVVGSPAWAPRSVGGPMPLPGDTKALGDAETAPPYLTGSGSEGVALDATGAKIVSNESPGSSVGAAGKATSSGSSSASSSGPAAVAGVDLWDSGWPSGRFYWTVVPVSVQYTKIPTASPSSSTPSGASGAGTSPSSSTPSGASGAGTSSSSGPTGASGSSSSSTSSTGGPIAYHDMAVPQDSCQAGVGMSFGKVSEPAVTGKGKPFLSGVGPTGRTVAAAGANPVVFASPIAAWQPVVGATKYQVELSRTLYPWHTALRVGTPATSIVLPVTKYDAGTWYYRVRGFNEALPVGARAMAWSNPVKVRVTGNRIAVVH